MADSEQCAVTLAITGASGAALGRCALAMLAADARVRRVDLVVSAHARRVAREELGLAEDVAGPDFPLRLLGAGAAGAAKIVSHDPANIGASIASGSYPSAGMVVAPCSMGTLAAIAHGLSDNLIERAADVCLKERRPLLLAARETPLSLVHLRNMVAATEAGARIFPVIPAFYDRAADWEASLRQFVARMLAHLGLPQEGAFHWQG